MRQACESAALSLSLSLCVALCVALSGSSLALSLPLGLPSSGWPPPRALSALLVSTIIDVASVRALVPVLS